MSARRILILTNRIPYPLNDGGNLAMKVMIDGYHKAGWEVCLLSMNTSRHFIPQQQLDNIYKDIRFETVFVDNSVKPLPTLFNYLFSLEPNHAVRFRNRNFKAKLQALLSSFRPDVVQVESVFLTGYLPVIKKAGNILTVLRLHNIEYQVWSRLADETKSFKGIYLHNLAKRIRKYEEQAWTEYDLLLPITDADAGFVKSFNKNILTTPFGIDISKAVNNIPCSEWKAYHIGAMDWLPNAEAISWFLKECWPAIFKKYPQLEFHFAGRNMPGSFKQLNIPGVVCAGEVPDADAFISNKNILIVPLRSGGGIRVKILEAMAAGKLVISTATGMQGIEAVPGKHYLLANDPEDFLTAVMWVYENPAKALEMAASASAFAKANFNEKHIAEQLALKLDNMLISKDL